MFMFTRRGKMLELKRIRRSVLLVISLACTSLALLAMMPPVLVMFKQYAWYDQVMAFFAQACHQQSTRCFWWAGFPMAICGRCLGIYFGVGYACLRQAFEFRPATTADIASVAAVWLGSRIGTPQASSVAAR